MKYFLLMLRYGPHANTSKFLDRRRIPAFFYKGYSLNAKFNENFNLILIFTNFTNNGPDANTSKIFNYLFSKG